MTDGVIFVAAGEAYRALALQAARSLRATNPDLMVDLFTDGPFADDPAQACAGLFDAVHPIPENRSRHKLACLSRTRFDRTLFLDCDVLVLAPLGDLFEIADRFPIAMAHDVRRRSGLVQEGFAQQTPYGFPQLNSGVILYRTCPETQAFFAEWNRRYEAAGVARDQVTLKDLLWQSDIRFYVLPPEFNLRRVTMLDAWEPLDATPTILHSHRLLQHVRGTGQRVDDPAEICALERQALADEWRGAEPDPEDPLARYRAGPRA